MEKLTILTAKELRAIRRGWLEAREQQAVQDVRVSDFVHSLSFVNSLVAYFETWVTTTSRHRPSSEIEAITAVHPYTDIILADEYELSLVEAANRSVLISRPHQVSD